MSSHPPVGIVGAGLTGLCLAQSLMRLNIPCFLLDKGRLPGGRMATTMVDEVPVDYGPGWFHTDDDTASPEVRTALDKLLAEGVDREDLPDGTERRLPADGRFRSWHVPGGMRRLAQELADSLEIHKSHHARRIERAGKCWKIFGTMSTQEDQPFELTAGALVLTQPWPQVHDLLDISGLGDISLPVVQPQGTDYERVIVLVIETPDFPIRDGSVRNGEIEGIDPIRSVRYRLSNPPGNGAIVSIFAEPGWSESHWDESDEAIRSQLVPTLELMCREPLRYSVIRQHRWKFAQLADAAYGNVRPVTLVDEPLLLVAGEAFGVTPESPAGILSAQESARQAARVLSDWGSGRSGP